MKKLFLIHFLILFISFTGCIEDGNSGEVSPIEEYFPMEVGNWWKYVEMETGDTFVREITRCDTFEGRPYYEIFEGGSIDGLLSCYNGRIDWIPSIIPIGDPTGWDILLKEPIEVGTEWKYGYEVAPVVIEDIYAKMIFPAGVFDSCVTVRWKNPGPFLSRLGWDFAPGVGIVRWVTITIEREDKSAVLLDYYIK